MKLAVYLSLIVLLTVKCTKRTKACFNYSPTDIKAGDAVIFNASCSKNAFSFIWDFKDSSGKDTTRSKIITHVFKNPGNYNVDLFCPRKDGVTIRKDQFNTSATVIVK